MKRIRIISDQVTGACHYYRRVLPYRFLFQPLKDRGIELSVSARIPHDEFFDGFIAYRHIYPDLLTHLVTRRAHGAKFAFDTDDDIRVVPKESPASPSDLTKEQIVAIRMLCDQSWVSTEPLAIALSKYPGCQAKNSKCLPNLLDLNTWGGGQQHPKDTERIRIAFQGSNTHDGDLKTVEEAIAVILKKYPQVDLLFFGDPPACWEFNWFNRIRCFGWCDLKDFSNVLISGRIHIGICPLAANQFNISKSCIKWAEYTLAGAVTVASPMPPYRVEEDRAMLYAHETDQWVGALSALIENHQLRHDLHDEAHDRVKRNWSWQHSPKREAWLGAMLSLAGGSGEPEQNPNKIKPAS